METKVHSNSGEEVATENNIVWTCRTIKEIAGDTLDVTTVSELWEYCVVKIAYFVGCMSPLGGCMNRRLLGEDSFSVK